MSLARALVMLVVFAFAVGACSSATTLRTTSRASTNPAPTGQSTSTNTTSSTTTATPHRESVYSSADQLQRVLRDEPIDLLIGQLITTRLDGQTLSPDETTALRSGRLGGVILFGYNVSSLQQLKVFTTSITAEGHSGSLMNAEPFIMADQEGGSTRAISQLPPDVSQPVMGRRGDASATEAQAAAAATTMRAAGVNVNLAPVADVDAGPAHVMRDRVFADQPVRAADQIRAAVTGYQHGDRIAATAKHFPGLGAATMNTDKGISHVHLSRAELAQEASPFQAAIDARVDMVMMSHAIYDGLGSTMPATLDHAIATDLLRGMGFEGVVISDSMNAKGLREGGATTVPQACPRAIAAGVDELLLTGSLETARLCHRRVKDAIADGTLTRDQVVRAVARVMLLKARLGLAHAGIIVQ